MQAWSPDLWRPVYSVSEGHIYFHRFIVINHNATPRTTFIFSLTYAIGQTQMDWSDRAVYYFQWLRYTVLVLLVAFFYKGGTTREITQKVWLLFNARYPSWNNLGLNLQPRDQQHRPLRYYRLWKKKYIYICFIYYNVLINSSKWLCLVKFNWLPKCIKKAHSDLACGQCVLL